MKTAEDYLHEAYFRFDIAGFIEESPCKEAIIRMMELYASERLEACETDRSIWIQYAKERDETITELRDEIDKKEKVLAMANGTSVHWIEKCAEMSKEIARLREELSDWKTGIAEEQAGADI